jgi:hypothetical protein
VRQCFALPLLFLRCGYFGSSACALDRAEEKEKTKQARQSKALPHSKAQRENSKKT